MPRLSAFLRTLFVAGAPAWPGPCRPSKGIEKGRIVDIAVVRFVRE